MQASGRADVNSISSSAPSSKQQTKWLVVGNLKMLVVMCFSGSLCVQCECEQHDDDEKGGLFVVCTRARHNLDFHL